MVLLAIKNGYIGNCPALSAPYVSAPIGSEIANSTSAANHSESSTAFNGALYNGTVCVTAGTLNICRTTCVLEQKPTVITNDSGIPKLLTS